MATITINVDDEQVNRLLRELEEKLDDPTPVLRDIGEYMLGSIDLGFQTETAPSGEPWQPNSPYTIALKQREGRIMKVLQSTGAMRGSFNYQISGSQLSLGGSDAKIPKHQFGIGTPKREILGIRQEDPENIADIMLAYLED